MALDIPAAIPDDLDMEILLTRLRELIATDVRSETKIAAELGLSQKRFNNYVRGIRDFPVEYIPDVCRVLDTHPNYLFGWSNQRRPKNVDIAQPTAALETEIRRLQRMLANFRNG